VCLISRRRGTELARRIGKNEDVAEALLRLICDDLVAAQRELRGRGRREERIHRVRQRLKRARSLLRVLTPAAGDRARTARHSLTEAARLLAGARDADVAVASARGLAAETVNEDIGLDRVVRALDREAAKAHRQAAPIGEVSRRLAAVIADVSTFGPDFDGSALLERALLKAYRKGRKGMRRSKRSPATSYLHEWRKQTKHFWHLTQAARKRLPRRIGKLARHLDHISDILGLDHDHAVLAERLALSPTGDLSLMRQLALIAKSRRAFEAEAFELGSWIYRDRPKAFARRVRIR
jgi:CHAD domain-containing protein